MRDMGRECRVRTIGSMDAPKPRIEEFDKVEALRDMPEHGVAMGARGFVVHVYGFDDAFTVQFMDDQGRTYALPDLHGKDLRVIEKWPHRAVNPP
jgi:hypothetical protein